MLRLRSLGRIVVGTLRSLLASFGAVVAVLRRLARPLKGLSRDLVGLIPALLAGAGVFLVVAGLFNYFSPAVEANPSPTDVVASNSPATYSLPPLVTINPSGSGDASPGTSEGIGLAVATRVVIPALNIDVPIVRSPPNEQYPLCNVAEYLSLGKDYPEPRKPCTCTRTRGCTCSGTCWSTRRSTAARP